MLTLTDLHVVGKANDRTWLMMPIGETATNEDSRVIYYKYDSKFKSLDGPKHLQVWCKYFDFVRLDDGDEDVFNKLIYPRMIKVVYPDLEKWEEGKHKRKGKGEGGGQFTSTGGGGEKVGKAPEIENLDPRVVKWKEKNYRIEGIKEMTDFFISAGVPKEKIDSAYDNSTKNPNPQKAYDEFVNELKAGVPRDGLNRAMNRIRIRDMRGMASLKAIEKPVKVEKKPKGSKSSSAKEFIKSILNNQEEKDELKASQPLRSKMGKLKEAFQADLSDFNHYKIEHIKRPADEDIYDKYLESRRSYKDNLRKYYDTKKELEKLESKQAEAVINKLKLPESKRLQPDISMYNRKAHPGDDEIVEHVNNVLSLFTNKYADILRNKKVRIIIRRINPKNGRSYCSFGTIHIVKPNATPHEMGHLLEMAIPTIKAKSSAFLEKRTAGEKAKLMAELDPEHHFGRDEKAKADKFPSPYCGKIYKSGDTEIVSMGVEYMFNNPRKFARNDPEYFEFIYNLMRGQDE